MKFGRHNNKCQECHSITGVKGYIIITTVTFDTSGTYDTCD